MTALPPIILELSQRVIGKQCTESLLIRFNYNDLECIKYGISKALGIGIVAGGSIMKLPQVITILNSQSSEGLSLASSILSTLAYLITTAYGYRSEFPFSTYGENLFLSVQDALISILVVVFSSSPSSSKVTQAIVTTSTIVGATAFLANADIDMLSMLQVATIPLSIGSKVPQVITNWRNGSTGQLSGIVAWVQVLGTVARIFTSLQEVNDLGILAAFASALVLNVIIALQILIYKATKTTSPPSSMPETKPTPVIASPTPVAAGYVEKDPVSSRGSSRASTPTLSGRPGTPGGSAGKAGGKKWSRKLAE